jgi:hypothetical protein
MMAMFMESQHVMGEALRNIVHNTAHGRHQRQGVKPNQYSEFKDFLDTKPPIFKEAKEPLQVDKWQNILEQKFRLLRVTVGIS